MRDIGLLAAAVLACLAGMAWLALAMEDHWAQVTGKPARPARLQSSLRLRGALALLAGLVLCLGVDHATIAVLVWVMALAFAAICVSSALTWRPSWLRIFAVGAR